MPRHYHAPLLMWSWQDAQVEQARLRTEAIADIAAHGFAGTLAMLRGCRYPLWGDDERPAYGEHRFCEAPRRPGTPYCAAHAAVCYARAVAAPDAALAARRGARIGRPAP